MKKFIIIGIVILLIILLFNRVNTKETFSVNVGDIIGCMDYRYIYKLNVPAIMTFYVIEKNEKDEEGFFKMITAEETEGSTILHCGNEYFLIVSAYGYKEYTEKIPAASFRPLIPEVHEINLEKD